MQFCPLAPLWAKGSGSDVSYFHALLPSQSDSQASSRSISGRHLLCSQMFPILSPSASQGGLLLLILVQIRHELFWLETFKSEGVILHVLSSSVFLKYTVLTEELMPQEKEQLSLKRQFRKKAHGGWWKWGSAREAPGRGKNCG